MYGVEDYELAIQHTGADISALDHVGEMELDDALVLSGCRLRPQLKASISDDIADWGITLKTVEIQDINPSGTMQAAMEEQAAAERAQPSRYGHPRGRG